MTNKHTAQYNDDILTRNSASRTYTHCVVAVVNNVEGAKAYIEANKARVDVLQAAMDAAKKAWDEDPLSLKALADEKVIREAGVPYGKPEYEGISAQLNALNDIHYGITYKAYQVTVKAYYEGAHTYNKAVIAVDVGQDGLLYEDGWAGRPDLAAKKVGAGCDNPYGKMVALETKMTETKKRAKKAA